MAVKPDPDSGINSWLEDELYQQYLRDHGAVDESWKHVFEKSGNGAPAAAPVPKPLPVATVEGATGEEWVPMRGAAARIAHNMDVSLAVPLATSQRTIPVKVIDENRRVINNHRTLLGKSKVSYTHIIGWAIVRALEYFPGLNHAYAEKSGEPFRIVRGNINLGVAVDVPGKDGGRNLLVPNIKDAGHIDFPTYVAAFDDLVGRARAGKLGAPDFQGTTISITNPGTVGTMQSIPRLMAGQGAIIAVGTIDYPAEYQGVAPEMRAALGISKVMTLTCTYDHRIIQGAESGLFLGKLQALLNGEDGFYEEVFEHLHLPYNPVRWEPDRQATLPGLAGRSAAEVAKEAAVLQLINAYRVRGHLIADLDPLGGIPSYHAELDPLTYGLTIWDLDREFLTGTLGAAIGESAPKPIATLREILETLRQTYCGKIGCEYMNIQHPEQKRWLQERMEPQANNWPLDVTLRTRILEHLVAAEEFENFLHARFIGQKRFSLQGGEAAIAILQELAFRAADRGVQEMVIGMAHRGRLTVLANVVGKPLARIFSQFEGYSDETSTLGSGDVKYHLGARGVRRSPAGNEIVMAVAPNPSHLEAVDPVVEGIVRPKQDRLGDTKRERVIPLLIHGDAAFAGQGVVAETLNLSQLDGYSTGGTVHLIINNQIGFTTLPDEARSTPYSTDVARMVQAPIFHVNGDDPEAAIRVAEIAFDYRQQFKKDVVIDMFCYRRYGHNEADDPSYTQPILYRKIRQHPSVAVLYADRLVREKVLSRDEVDAMRKTAIERFATAFDGEPPSAEPFAEELSAVAGEEMAAHPAGTAIDPALLARVVDGITRFPENFHLHPKLRGFIDKRREALAKGGPVDWAFAEALAFGSLVIEGTPVRLSGQDSGRGTFSQRHLVFYDAETGRDHIPLQHLGPEQAHFDVFDSLLSEYAVLGFEFGYSVADPLTLVMWEAQFGDFTNGAQIMVDQFISSAEAKWGQPSGLVMLLPHGFDGQGPEHSSARIERFLTLCAGDNMQLANCTTPAQYFHLLRRQMYGGRRKPLVIFTPKRLLRDPHAASAMADFSSGSFREVLDDPAASNPAAVARVIFCSGQIYYDLVAAREAEKAGHAAIVRVEQLYPFDSAQAQAVIARYPVTSEVIWAQEEPRNMGAWRFVYKVFESLLEPTGRKIQYAGRVESASPATGSLRVHQAEQAQIVREALGGAAAVPLKPKKK